MSEAKKIKLYSPNKAHDKGSKHGKNSKRNYYANPKQGGSGEQSNREHFMKPGHRGFLITCNGHVRDCVRDSYRILNEYADEMGYGATTKTDEEKPATVSDEEEDISIQLQKEAKEAARKDKSFRFQNVQSGAMNCLFIATTLPDPNEIAYKLMKELAATKKHKSRFILRMLPIEAVCRANIKDIMDSVGTLCDRYFLKEPKTYAIIFNRRLNNDLSRNDVIQELADLITAKNAGNKANLKNPDLAVIVEVIKGLCCIGVLREYYQLRKYNVVEITSQEANISNNVTTANEKSNTSQEANEETSNTLLN
ncbi:THUMP domain-containing protein 1 homolog [Anopheles nili]|uniref:THUMP domain-containing protein 1 homolog n=1 Tax=Anopheles nili TaxID=185578 RepID=UPI00237BC704|nr:THUMP domain-containing protein 1 homolog [Anopheles nili]